MYWAWEQLPVDHLWALIRTLPESSAFHRLAGTSTRLEENVATLVDFLVDQRFSQWRADTFNPDRWPEHKQAAVEAKRNPVKPPDLPPIVPVALRPDGQLPLTAALTALPDADVEELDGHAAHERLQQLLT